MPGTDPMMSSAAWRTTRLAVLQRDGWRCQIQGPRCTQRATQVDHIRARRHGGARLDPANLRAACAACNAAGGAQITAEIRSGRALGRTSRAW